MTGDFIKKIIDFIEMKSPGVDFVFRVGGETVSDGFITRVVVAERNRVDGKIFILIPSPDMQFEITGIPEFTGDDVPKGKLPGDFN